MSNPETKWKRNIRSIVLTILVISLAGLSAVFYYQRIQWEQAYDELHDSYSSLRGKYVTLQNTSSIIKNNYDELRAEYTVLSKLHSNLTQNHSILEDSLNDLQKEYDELINLEKKTVLETSRTLNILPNGNETLSYDTVYAGYIELNFTSSEDIYLWVGSSLLEETYYARYPPYPQTAMNGTFTVPVVGTIHVYFNNPNKETEVTVIYTMSLTY